MPLQSLLVVFSAVLLLLSSAVSYQCDVKESAVNGTKHGFYPGNRWPNGVVKYELHSSLTPANRVEIQKAFNEIQTKTCIRFQQRSPGEPGFVNIYRHFEGCADATICYAGREQYLRFSSPGCDTMSTIVHELGHTLCLTHEHERKDRDDYVTFNAPCNPNPFKNDYDTRGHPYDYASQMHYQCFTCSGGWPKQSGVRGCGQTVTVGLSVVDANKINEFYGCRGRYAYRWRNIEQLTETDLDSLKPFGNTSGYPLFLCRATINGEIVAGRFSVNDSTCYIPVNVSEEVISSQAQVFTVPQETSFKDVECEYKALPINKLSGNDDAYIAVGTNANGAAGYAAIINTREGASKIGTVWNDDLGKESIPFMGRQVQNAGFALISCQYF